jgi:hypothetical protein
MTTTAQSSKTLSRPLEQPGGTPKRVYHVSFPEIWVECHSVHEGLKRLASRLAQHLEGSFGWQRDAVASAIADIERFHGQANHLRGLRSGADTPLRCEPKPARPQRARMGF